jgi:hypothetical protein
VANPVPLGDDFVLQAFVKKLMDKVKDRKSVLDSCLSRTQRTQEFNKKVHETIKQA